MNDYFGEIHDRQVADELTENAALIDLLFPGQDMTGLSILDAGCGRGGWSIAFGCRKAKWVMGVDISLASLKTAVPLCHHQRATNVHFACSNIEQLPVADGAAQIVFCWGSLHYCDSPEAGLKELLRVCSSSGQLFIAVHANTSLTWLHDTLRWLVTHLPRRCRQWLLALCVTALQIIGRLTGSKRLKGSRSVQQKVTERWFYPGTLHSLRANDLLECARKLGWAGQYVSLDHPNRYNPSNSFLLRFRKRK